MARLIDADALEDSLGISNRDLYTLECLREAPTVDATHVVHGLWEYRDGVYSCSVCGDGIDEDVFLGLYNDNFCPNCGAKMDAEGRTDGKT